MLVAALLVLQLSGLSTSSIPVAAANDPPVPAAGDRYEPVVVVLDTSSSMTERDSKGTERLVGARSAVLGLVDALPPGSPFALIAYPGDGGREVSGCPEGNVEVKLGPLDQATAAAAVRRLTADGDTPTEPALRHAARLIQNSATQKGTVVLVSDGESNCGSTDVCEVARELVSQGIALRVNTVGFQISETGAQELACISDATGGQYADAQDEQQLQNVLQDLSGARLTLEASMPDPLPVVSGTGTEGPKVLLTVTNPGRKPARDVRLSLDFKDTSGRPGAILVPRPIRFLGNLEPGQTRTIDMTVRPDPARIETFTWQATTTATNAIPQAKRGETKTGEPTLAGLLADVDNLVVLGDSYSSGEGAGDYTHGTNGESSGNYCHRSTNAYGKVLKSDATLIACSGAVTSNFYIPQRNGQLVEPQLRQLRTLAVSDRSPDAVLLSIGGNDVGFASTVATCMLGAPGQTCTWDGDIEERRFRSEAVARIAAVADSLRRVYRDVNRAVNDPVARAKREGEHAPIIIVPYPRILPSTQAGVSGTKNCAVNINTKEAEFFNSFIDALNLQIGAVAGELRKQHQPIYVAADVISAFQPNHTICDVPNNYANTPGNLAVPVFDSGTLHPNAAGNKAMARSISAWSASTTMMSDPASVTWASVDTYRPVFNGALSLGGTATAGGRTQVTAEGYDPDTTVVFRLDSIPRVLETATASDIGSISTQVEVPADIPPGTHHIHVLGFTPDGRMHDTSIQVRVLPPQTLAAIIVTSAGLLAALIGLLGMLCNRRRA